MGKGKRAQSINIPNLIAPKSSFDHSYAPLNLNEPKKYQNEKWQPPRKPKINYNDLEHKIEDTPLFVLVSTYLNYLILILFGHLRDGLGKFFYPNQYTHLKADQGYAPLVADFDSFYTRRIYMRIRDVFNRPITGVASRKLTLLDRVSTDFNRTFKLTGGKTETLNLASYNYLGFADNEGLCADEVEVSTRDLGISTSSPRAEGGTSLLLRDMERTVARFVGKEDSMCVSMGFATNSTTIPALVNKGCLVISDELNHASLIFGIRLSGASVRVFKHNDMNDLRKVLRESISQGQPRTHRAWKKIVVVVEGLYSMEGTIVNLPVLIDMKKEFKFYLYVDEAHSIGALGENGGGVCDFYGVDPADVDILMGTFTKSFGAAGGYIAADKAIIDHLRIHTHSYNYAESVSVPVAQQVITSMKIMCGEDGTDFGRKKIKQLAENSVYFMERLKKLGFIVYGDQGSPVIPVLLFNPAKVIAFSRELLKLGIAVVVVGYPATPIISSRARFCMSAAHTKEDMDRALDVISKVGDDLLLKLSSKKDISK